MSIKHKVTKGPLIGIALLATLTAMDIGRISYLCPTISQGRFRDIQQDIL